MWCCWWLIGELEDERGATCWDTGLMLAKLSKSIKKQQRQYLTTCNAPSTALKTLRIFVFRKPQWLWGNANYVVLSKTAGRVPGRIKSAQADTQPCTIQVQVHEQRWGMHNSLSTSHCVDCLLVFGTYLISRKQRYERETIPLNTTKYEVLYKRYWGTISTFVAGGGSGALWFAYCQLMHCKANNPHEWTKVLTACEKGGLWQEGTALVQDMQLKAITPNQLSFSGSSRVGI